MPRAPETAEEALAAAAKALGWNRVECRGRQCGGLFYWAKHSRTSKAIPIDAGSGLNHFIVCPDAGAFRRTAKP